MIRLTLNGRETTLDVDPEMPAPVGAAGITPGRRTPKYGCGIAQCGACMVHVDGQAVPRSCVTPASAVGGRGR